MSRCPQCQHENPPGARFCNGCGTRAELACAQCGQINPSGSGFCNGCGAKLGGPSPTGPQPRFASPEAYTPRHLAEKILTSKAALEGERKQVTVLFADLKGSMELLADRDPEEARKILDPVLELMMEAVHRYEGTVNQVMGDGIMALFGAPLAHEDHAVRACYAALWLQESIRPYAETVRREQGALVSVRVGLNSGEVVVRSIGSDLHMDYTAVGQTTHLAARMEQLARPATIVLTDATRLMVEGYVELKPLGPLPVKGLSAAVEAYEAVRATPVRSRLEAAALRGLTRFVGRDRELDHLRAALERARGGHGQAVAIIGEPGIGKSRLFWEFTRSADTEGWRILETSATSLAKSTPYLPIIDLLKTCFQVNDGDDHERIRNRLTTSVSKLEAPVEQSALMALLDVSLGNPEWTTLDPAQRRRRIFDAVKGVIIRESQLQPLLLVVENLHWIDSETQLLLDELIESLPSARLLLLVNYRPDYQHGWGNKPYYVQLRLDPLSRENASELLDSLLGPHLNSQALKTVLVEQTDGNPFFLEEMVRALVETNVLVGERGAYRLAAELSSIHVPPTVQAVLATRIDRLPADEKRLLQTAAVIGRHVPMPLLRGIVELPEESLRQALNVLQKAEFLYESRLFPELEYTFKHALTHGVAYASLLQDRRRDLHARILEAIERLYPERLAEQAETLAYHASRGELWPKALNYSRQAGDKAFARAALQQAVVFFEQALDAIRHLPQTREAAQHAIDFRLRVRHALLFLGDFDRISEHLSEAARLAESLDDQPRLGLVWSNMTQYFWAIGDLSRGVEAGQRARAIANALGDRGLGIGATFHLGLVRYSRGDYEQAAELFSGHLEALTGKAERERFGMAGYPSVFYRSYLALCLGEAGNFVEAVSTAEAAMRLADSLEQAYTVSVASSYLGQTYLGQGQIQKAISAYERSVRVCRDRHIPGLLSVALSGRVVEAVPLLETGVQQSRVTTSGHISRTMIRLSEAYLLAGRSDEGGELAHRSLTLAREREEHGNEAWALYLLGEATPHSTARYAENAEAHFGQALALAQERGMRPLVAHCHLGLGKLYRRISKREQAQEHLTTATMMYREMDVRFWLEQAEGPGHLGGGYGFRSTHRSRTLQ